MTAPDVEDVEDNVLGLQQAEVLAVLDLGLREGGGDLLSSLKLRTLPDL